MSTSPEEASDFLMWVYKGSVGHVPLVLDGEEEFNGVNLADEGPRRRLDLFDFLCYFSVFHRLPLYHVGLLKL